MKVIALKKLSFIGAFLFLLSCNSKTYKDEVGMESVSLSNDYNTVSNKTEANLGENPVPNLKIIKSAEAKYKVKNVKLATQNIKNSVQRFGGYISELRFDNNMRIKENRFTIKIPERNFDTILASLGKDSEFVDYENISTEDVSEEYVDIETRLKTKKEIKQRYESILRKNAKTVKDILATEEKLRIIQEEIESAQGRLKYLSSKVSYSTINVIFYETVNYKEEPETFERTFLSKLKEGALFGVDIIKTIIITLVYLWPLILVGLLLFFVLKKRWANRKG